MTRRGLARAVIAGGLGGLLAAAARPPRIRFLRVRYRTDPKRLASLLPPPLGPDVLPDIQIDYFSAQSAGLFPPADREEELAWFTLRGAARYGRRRGMLVLGSITNDPPERTRAREGLGLPVSPGHVALRVDGDSVRAWCRLDGKPVHRIETVVEDRPPFAVSADPDDRPSYLFRFTPGVNSSRTVIDPPVELWRIDGLHEPSTDTASPAAACDISRTEASWGVAAWADAGLALPPKEFVGAWYLELRGKAAETWLRRRSAREQAFVSEVDASSFSPWVFSRYPRPLRTGPSNPKLRRGPVLLEGRLSPDELSAYRRRKEDSLGPMSLAEFRVSIDPEVHAEVLPPGCDSADTPLLRVMILRSEGADLAARPFQEAWLFAYCRVDDQPRWYALSHIAGQGADVLTGRERFGYPTLEGNVDLGLSTEGLSFSASRRGHTLARGSASFRGFSSGLSLARIDVVSLRARPFRPGRPRAAELIEQTWFYQGRRHYADNRSPQLDFPPRPASGTGGPEGARVSPWFEFAPLRVVAAGAMEDAHMQRAAGRIVGEVPDFEAFYRERCDGVLPDESVPENGVAPTFRGGRDRPRS